MIENVLCTAPLASVLIDTHKGIRPCCYFQGNFMGNIKEQPISEILSSDRWKQLKQKMYNKEWPSECLDCKKIEDDTGFSLRKAYLNGSIDIEGWENSKLTYIEFNGSNICNLACLHCHPGFSSRWVTDNKKAVALAETFTPEKKERANRFRSVARLTDDTRFQTTKMHLPNPELVLENLKQLDLTNIRTLNFKGGEPCLNSETVAVLQHVDDLGLLGNIKVYVTTNGTYITDEMIFLLSKSKHVEFLISVDGVGELFNYIRYGDAKFNDIEPVIARVNTLNNVNIRLNCSTMNYNAFNLVEIRDWKINLSKKYDKIITYGGFQNMVQSPAYLSVNTLSDNVRNQLIDYYTANNDSGDFSIVITTLRNNYLGDEEHQKWVEYTELMESIRGNNILELVPQLTSELKRNVR
jgi:radical SAM protein with 4Fe4S-binding SPASM domain